MIASFGALVSGIRYLVAAAGLSVALFGSVVPVPSCLVPPSCRAVCQASRSHVTKPTTTTEAQLIFSHFAGMAGHVLVPRSGKMRWWCPAI